MSHVKLPGDSWAADAGASIEGHNVTPKPPSLTFLTLVGPLMIAVGVPGQAAAQFGFFDGPLQYRTAYQLRPRYRPHPIAPRAAAEVPLPPPRPHFPSDPPDAPSLSEAPPRKPDELAKPQTVKPEPAQPAPAQPEPAKPELPARPASEPRPQMLPNPPTTPSMTVGPTPEELPPKGRTALPGSKPIPSPPAPSIGQSTAATAPPLPPEKPAELKQTTGVAPSGAKLGEAPRQPEDDVACLDKLKARNVSVEPTTIGPQKDERCTVIRPVHLLALTLPDGGKVEFPEHPTIACTTADAFSLYVRDLLAPLAKGALGSQVAAVWTGPGLECRSRDSIFGAKLSAHGQGLAIDIAQIKLADGRKIEVGEPKDDAGQAFENAARAAACGYFHTVLGPGSDSYHRTHWHFDLIVRGAQGDSKYCK